MHMHGILDLISSCFGQQPFKLYTVKKAVINDCLVVLKNQCALRYDSYSKIKCR